MTSEEAVRIPGDEWPDYLTPETIDKTVLNTLLGDHFRATGGKDKALTTEIMEATTGLRSISHIEEENYRKLAKALIKDAARYTYGIKKPK